MALTEGKDYRISNGELEIKKSNTWIKIQPEGCSVRETIAAGANGVTILAHHNILDRDVVIKVWLPRNDDVELYEEKFKAEIRKIANLNSPYIAQIYDGKKLESGFCYSVMEYIKGCTLKEWIENHDCSCFNPSSMMVYRNLISAIMTYQEEGIIHGDIHNGNIIVSPDENVHLIDFGTSFPNHKELSKIRELRLEYESITSLIKKIPGFSEKHFIFSNIGNKLVIKKEFNFIKDLEPLLLTQTLYGYACVLKIMSSEDLSNKERIKRLAYVIAHSSYLDVCQILSDILERDKVNKKIFFNALFENLDTAIFSDCPIIDNNNFYSNEILGAFSLQAYINWIRNASDAIIINDDNSLLQGSGITLLEVEEMIKDTNINSFDIYKKFVKHSDYNAFDAIREILFNSIQASPKTNSVEWLYFINTSIRRELLDNKLRNAAREISTKIDIESIKEFFHIENVQFEDVFKCEFI